MRLWLLLLLLKEELGERREVGRRDFLQQRSRAGNAEGVGAGKKDGVLEDVPADRTAQLRLHLGRPRQRRRQADVREVGRARRRR